MKEVKEGDQVPLHIANLHSREAARAIKSHAVTVVAASSAAIQTAMMGRPYSKRTQKPLRAPVTEDDTI